MPGFMYFIEGVIKDEPTLVTDHGIGYAVEGPPPTTVAIRQAGPSDSPGLLVVDSTFNTAQLKYFPDRQEWKNIPESQVWIGRYTDLPMTPDDLARKSQLRGKPTILSDEQRWLIPTARSWIEQDGDARWTMDLPQKRELNGDGKWAPGAVVSKYAKLWDYAQAYWSVYTGAEAEEGEKVDLTYSDATDAMVAAMQTNYRVGPHECIMLDLTSDDNVSLVLNALVSFQDFVDIVTKKKPPQPTTSTKGGRKGKTKPIAQPA